MSDLLPELIAERGWPVAGSMGPSGEHLVPMGEMTPESCFEGFAEQAVGLVAGGADLLWIETMSNLDEVEAVVHAPMRAALDAESPDLLR